MTDAPSTDQESRVEEPRQHPASVFWRYWTATTTSQVGSAFTAVALPLAAVSLLDATAWQVGLLVAAGDLGWLLLTLPAGALVTHLPLRGLQATVDFTRGFAMLLPAVMWMLGDLSMVHLWVAALTVGFANVFAFVANTTYIPSVVPREQLVSRNSLMSGTDAMTQLGAPPAAGVFVGWLGAPVAFVLDAVSYLVSGALMWTLPRSIPVAVERQPMRSQIREGWNFVVTHPLMRPMMLDAAAINLACGFLLTLTPLYVVRELGASPGVFGLVLATEGVGALLGATFGPRLTRRWGSGRMLLWSAWLSVPAVALMPLGDATLGLVAFAAGNALFAFFTVILSVITRTYRQQESPPEMLARVMATVRFVSWSMIPVGGVLGGWAAGAFSSGTALWLLVPVTALSPLVQTASPLRHLREVIE
ncbi:MFS transporter [Nocardioides sp.]|uniref:MFS transporter n=1 Tax=Nocardioides sp. TaxID=35761 RepID=UPI002D1D18F9|nr:MFS transporter [Nocardioides sp.]HXH80791.1 MFS transporter [Nocardioides sp.]